MLVVPTLADEHKDLATYPLQYSWQWWVSRTPVHVLWAGHEAVVVFFVLSGFVLALPAASGRSGGWRSYYPQRLLRLYLPILGATGFAFALGSLVPHRAWTGSSWWLASHGSGVTLHGAVHDALVVFGSTWLNSAFWSLRWEVYFSLLLPLYLVALVRLRIPAFVSGTVLLTSVALGSLTGHGKLLYLPMFALGVLMAAKLSRLESVGTAFDRLQASWRVMFGVGVVLLLLAKWELADANAAEGVSAAAGDALVVAGACLLVWLFAATSAGRGFGTRRAAAWLGKRSFSLYLVHEPIVVSLAFVLRTTNAALLLAYALPIALIAAEVFGRCCEVPAHRLAKSVGDRLRSGRESVVLISTAG